MLRRLTCCILAFVATANTVLGATPIRTRTLVSTLNRPVYITPAPNDATHMYIVEKRGVIKLLDLTNNTVSGTAVMDISAAAVNVPDRKVISVTSNTQEQGLLGLAFHPNFNGTTNRFFYVDYINPSGNSVIARYQTTVGNQAIGDPASELILLSVTQPEPNHNGGTLQFGPDGKLYISFGDGGGQFDQHTTICATGNGQCPATYLGKILRMDVDIASPYVPADNPTIGDASHRLTWNYGLRNPFRFSFDRMTGDLYIGHVGQNQFEWVNYSSAATASGRNYGWRCMDACVCSSTTFGANNSTCPTTTGPPGCPAQPSNWTPPLICYTHSTSASGSCISGGSTSSNCVIGGYVYRGGALPDLQGQYFFADNGSGKVWSLRVTGDVPVGSDCSTTRYTLLRERTCEFNNTGSNAPGSIVSFGQDLAGELYLVNQRGTTTGEIMKIEANPNITFTQQPASQTVCPGQPVTFTVAISGITPSSYVWRKNGVTIAGAPNSASYTIPSVAAGDAGVYSVIASNCPTTGGFLSNDATLTIGTVQPADINADCVRNGTDLTLFVQVLMQTDTDPNHVSRSDLNSSGGADSLDIQPFVSAFLAP